MPKLPCIGCGVPIQPNKYSRCANCLPAHIASRAPRVRANANERGYDAQWRKLREYILQRDGMVCHYCQMKLDSTNASVDHVIPLSKDKSLSHTPSNLVACCRKCNSSLQDK